MMIFQLASAEESESLPHHPSKRSSITKLKTLSLLPEMRALRPPDSEEETQFIRKQTQRRLTKIFSEQKKKKKTGYTNKQNRFWRKRGKKFNKDSESMMKQSEWKNQCTNRANRSLRLRKT